ncbi:MAG: hypothetical protein J4G00_10575 [Actinomycetia bacterium]|nr:hypothetical protein [Actinomycetes bacterium]
MAARSLHSCGLRTDRTVACWGNNDEGEANPPQGTSMPSPPVGTTHARGIPAAKVTCWGETTRREAFHPPGSSMTLRLGHGTPADCAPTQPLPARDRGMAARPEHRREAS